MSRSLFDLFTQLNISEQKDVREHVHYTLDPVTYIKEKFTLLPRVEQEAFARLIRERKVVPSVPCHSKMLFPQSSDEEDSSDQEESSSDEEDNISSDEEITSCDTRLDDALLDYPVNGHCSRCTCNENDDCACARGCDHYYGTAEDLDGELDEIQNNYYRWYFATHYAKGIKEVTQAVSPKTATEALALPRAPVYPKGPAKAGIKATAKASPIISKILLPAPPPLILPRVPTLPTYQ